MNDYEWVFQHGINYQERDILVIFIIKITKISRS